MANKIHVLLVEHENPDTIINMLHYLSYQVTIVSLAATAVSVLSNEKVKYDLVIANLHSPDTYAFQLLQFAVTKDVLVILMSNIDDPPTTMMALEQGAFLCIEKRTLTMQILEYLWQHVSREKLIRLKEREQEQAVQQQNPEAQEGIIDIRPKRNVSSEHERVPFKRKVWTEWTVELHTKFMNAAKQLGPGRCYPKDILELMNVPGLTRMQVASHLQKCRSAKWLPPEKRKYKQYRTSDAKSPCGEGKHPRAKTLKFGSMPFLDDQLNHQELLLDPLPQAAVYGAGSSNTNYVGYQILDDAIIPFGPDGETFDAGLGFSSDEAVPFVYGHDHVTTVPDFAAASNQDAFELQMMDLQNFPGFQGGGMGYDGSWTSENQYQV